jgi:nucleoside-diphosphate-sugar epimerase
MTKLIFGCGYLGSRVAALWKAAGHEVVIVTRNAEKADSYQQQGYKTLVADVTSLNASTFAALPAIETVLFAVGWDRSAGQTIHNVYVNGLQNVLSHLPTIQRFIYISSTGVFGRAAGDWVTEQTPCIPLREGGKACLSAEQALLNSSVGERSIILRLAGIYGPQRIPRAKDLIAGIPIDAPSQGWLNLIHVDDAARIVLQAEVQSATPELYLVADGTPVLRSDYYAELANLLQAPAPVFVTPNAASPAAQRASSDKRISNRKLVATLQPIWLYNDYRAGLRGIVKE